MKAKIDAGCFYLRGCVITILPTKDLREFFDWQHSQDRKSVTCVTLSGTWPVPGFGGTFVEIEVRLPSGGLLEEIQTTASVLGDTYGWTRLDSLVYILCGVVPSVSCLEVDLIKPSGNPVQRRLRLTVDPQLPVDVVMEAYLQARDSLGMSKARPRSEATLKNLITYCYLEDGPTRFSGLLKDGHVTSKMKSNARKVLRQNAKLTSRRVLGITPQAKCELLNLKEFNQALAGFERTIGDGLATRGIDLEQYCGLRVCNLMPDAPIYDNLMEWGARGSLNSGSFAFSYPRVGESGPR